MNGPQCGQLVPVRGEGLVCRTLEHQGEMEEGGSGASGSAGGTGALGVLGDGGRWEAGRSPKVRTWQRLPGRTMEHRAC